MRCRSLTLTYSESYLAQQCAVVIKLAPRSAARADGADDFVAKFNDAAVIMTDVGALIAAQLTNDCGPDPGIRQNLMMKYRTPTIQIRSTERAQFEPSF